MSADGGEREVGVRETEVIAVGDPGRAGSGPAMGVVVLDPIRVRSWRDVFDQMGGLYGSGRVPSPALLLQLRRNAAERDAFLRELGALDYEQVAELAGSKARDRRSTGRRWGKSGRIFSVTFKNKTWFPGFQFDYRSARPKPAVRAVLDALPARMLGWELALWWTAPSDILGLARPVELLDSDPAAVVEAARAEAAHWAESGFRPA